MTTEETGNRPTDEFMKEVLYKNIDIWSQYSWVHGYEVGDYSDSIFPEYRTKGSGITVKVDIVEGREEALANMPQSVKGVPVRYIFAPRYELLMSGERAVHRPSRRLRQRAGRPVRLSPRRSAPVGHRNRVPAAPAAYDPLAHRQRHDGHAVVQVSRGLQGVSVQELMVWTPFRT